MPAPRADKKTDLLLAVLRDVPFDGWTAGVFDKAAGRLKISKTDAYRIFPRGITDVALYLSEWADTEMLKKLTPGKMKDLRVRDKITLGVRKRLEILAPHREAARNALKILSFPPASFMLTKSVWTTADKIWQAAGDTATDYNHYTKRLLLSGVLSATTLYWLNDRSEGLEKTWTFLDRRISNVLTLGQALSKVRKKA